MAKLRDLATQVHAVLPPHWHFAPEQIYACLDVRGESYNNHLANPLNRNSRWHCDTRPVALTGDEDVHGRFHTFDCNDHDPYLFLTSHASLEEMADFILSSRGILNSYLTFMLAFVHFAFVPYAIYYRSNKEWLMFDKCKTEIFDDVTENGMAVRIEWLEGSSRCTVSQYEYDR
jgi:hypothetical protein